MEGGGQTPPEVIRVVTSRRTEPVPGPEDEQEVARQTEWGQRSRPRDQPMPRLFT